MRLWCWSEVQNSICCDAEACKAQVPYVFNSELTEVNKHIIFLIVCVCLRLVFKAVEDGAH